MIIGFWSFCKDGIFLLYETNSRVRGMRSINPNKKKDEDGKNTIEIVHTDILPKY